MKYRYGLLTLALIGLLTGLFGPQPLSAQQQIDVAVTSVIEPPSEVVEGSEVLITFKVQNIGNQPAVGMQAGGQIAAATAPNTPLFQDLIPMAPLAPGEEVTVAMSMTWTATPPGDYIVSAAVAFENDMDQNNNLMQLDFVVVPQQEDLLTLQEAIDVLNTEVLDGHERADSLLAFHLSPPQNPSDSLVPPGVRIESADGLYLMEFDRPVYFFFVDLYPDEFFSHPVEYIAIDAISGTVDRNLLPQLWPLIDGEVPEFGPTCGGVSNPRLVRGNARPCAPKENPYELKNTTNKKGWALALVGQLLKDKEKTTVDGDICKWKERINGTELGPQVSGENIATHAGANKSGLTKQELCDAIDALKGKGCDKVYVKYFGHGTKEGILLWGPGGKGTVTLSWADFAKKLKEAGIGEASIEINSCHSGAAIEAMRKAGIKGTIVTATDANTKLRGKGDGSSTAWEEALLGCSKDRLADLNKSGKIDQCELYAWVKSQGGAAANRARPQLAKLASTIRIIRIGKQRVHGKPDNINTDDGSVRVETRYVCYLRDSAGKRSVRYRGAVYLVNDNNNVDKTIEKSFNITMICKGRKVTLTVVVPMIVKAGQRICIVDLPDTWTPKGCKPAEAERVKKKGTEEKGGVISTASAAPDDAFGSVVQAATVATGSFNFYRYDLVSDASETDIWSFQAIGPDGWNVTAEPVTFSMPENDSLDLYVGANVPDDATAGGAIVGLAINTTTNDTIELVYELHLVDTLDGDDLANGSGSFRWYDVTGASQISGTSNFDNSVFNVVDSLRFGASTTHDLERVTMAADEGADLAVVLADATLDFTDIALYGARDGLVVTGGDIEMSDIAVVDSRGSGLSLSDGVAVDQLQSVNIIDAVGDGLLLGSIDEVVTIENLRIENAGGMDVVLNDGTDLDCIDCMYDDDATTVGAGSLLQRFARLNVVVSDTAEVAIPGISVRVLDASGTEVFAGLTDEDGFIPTVPMLVSTNDGGNLTKHGPYEVIVRTDQVMIRDTIDATGWTGRVYTLPGNVTSVESAVAGTSRMRISPMPAAVGGNVRIATGRLAAGSATARLHDINGTERGTFVIGVSSEDLDRRNIVFMLA